MSTPTLYTHHPLPSSHHIRLLEFPGYTDEDQPLRGTIRVVDIEEATVPYVALSYTWGQPNFSKDLLLDNDELFRITPTLAAALRRFRYASALRWIWVDAICINQQDDAEKTTQIPLMGDIYRGASRVMVWLGDRVQDEDLLHQIKRLIGSMSDPHEDYALATRLIAYLSQLARLPWFSRRWIIQELALNSNAVLCCGQAELPFGHLGPTLQLVDDQTPDVQNLRLLWDLWRDIAMPLGTKNKEDSDRDLLGDRDIAALMKSCQAFECLDGRDRIAALLGLSTDARTRFTVDYAVSVEETFLVFGESLAKSGHMAWLINQSLQRRIGRVDQDQTLPSWVPDWTIPIPRHMETSKLDTKFYERVPCEIQVCPTDPRLHLLTAKFSELEITVTRMISSWNSSKEDTLGDCIKGPASARGNFTPAPMQVAWKSILFPKDADLAERMALSLVDLWPWVVARLSRRDTFARRRIWRGLRLRLLKSLAYSVDHDSRNIEIPTLKFAGDYPEDWLFSRQDIINLEALRSYLTAKIRECEDEWYKDGGLSPISCLLLCRRTSHSDTLNLGDVCVMGSLQLPFYHTIKIGDQVLLADLGNFHFPDGRISSELHVCKHIVREHPAFDGTDSAWSRNERGRVNLLAEVPYVNGSYGAAAPVVYEFIAPCNLSSIFFFGKEPRTTFFESYVAEDGELEVTSREEKNLIERGSETLSIWVR